MMSESLGQVLSCLLTVNGTMTTVLIITVFRGLVEKKQGRPCVLYYHAVQSEMITLACTFKEVGPGMRNMDKLPPAHSLTQILE